MKTWFREGEAFTYKLPASVNTLAHRRGEEEGREEEGREEEGRDEEGREEEGRGGGERGGGQRGGGERRRGEEEGRQLAHNKKPGCGEPQLTHGPSFFMRRARYMALAAMRDGFTSTNW